MDDFVVDVNGRAVRFQRELHDVYCANNARAKAARPYPQQDFSVLFSSSLHHHPKL